MGGQISCELRVDLRGQFRGGFFVVGNTAADLPLAVQIVEVPATVMLVVLLIPIMLFYNIYNYIAFRGKVSAE